MSGEWGPWVTHDGAGCPVVGQYVEAVWEVPFYRETSVCAGIVLPEGVAPWDWCNFEQPSPHGFWGRVLRYRVRRPLGMKVLDKQLADIPAIDPFGVMA